MFLNSTHDGKHYCGNQLCCWGKAKKKNKLINQSKQLK